MMKISVVVPAYNEENYLGACLASLKKQDFKGDFEVIVVDNNSTDKTSQIAKQAGVKVVFEPQQGVCFARQRGLEEAGGEIIVSTDADCIFPENWLSNISQAFLENKNSVAVVGPYKHKRGPGSGNWFFGVWFGLVFIVYKLSKKLIYPPAANFSFYKKDIEVIGGYNIKLNLGGDEYDLLKRIKQRGKVIYLDRNKVETSNRRLRNGVLYNFIIGTLFCYLLDYFLAGRLTRSPLAKLFSPVRKEASRGKILLEQIILSFLALSFSVYFLFFSTSSPVYAKTQEGVAFVHRKIDLADYQIKKESHKLKVAVASKVENLKYKQR